MSNKTIKTTKGKKQAQGSLWEVAVNILEYLTCILGIALAVLVPLYLKDGYHGVGDCKYELYKILMIIGTTLLFFITLIGLLQNTDVLKKIGRQDGQDTDKKEGTLKKILQSPPALVAVFLLLAFWAAVIGGNFKSCMVGYTGWFMGLLSLASFAVLYYYFAYAGRYYKAVIIALLGTSFLTYIFGILNRMMIDVLGTYGLGTEKEIADHYKNMFLSTLGQASWYSSFVCTLAPLGFALFLYAKKRLIRILSAGFVFVASMTMVTQNSDSAYMAMLGFFFVFFWFSVKDAGDFRRFCELLVLFAGATRGMWILLVLHPNPVLELDALSTFMVYSEWMWGILAGTILLWGISLFLEKKQLYPAKGMLVFRMIALIVILLALWAAFMVLLLDAKGLLLDGALRVTEKIPYMTWSDNWGNGRGRTWEFNIQMFKDMDLFHKLFGVGPDGYAYYAYNLYAERLESMWGSRTLTNAHNEWMNAVINYGVVGATVYIGIFVSSVKRFSAHIKDEPILIGFIACIVSYMCHNFFCYQTVCCTPYIFMLMGMGMYLCGKENV